MKYISYKIALLCILIILTGCSKDKSNKIDNSSDYNTEITTDAELPVDTEDYNDLYDGSFASLEYDEEFEDIYNKIEGEWLSEDELSCLTISYDGENYIYSRYLVSENNGLGEDTQSIYSLKYEKDESDDNQDNEEVIVMKCNSDIMQAMTKMFIDDGNYIRICDGNGTSTYYYHYERTVNEDFTAKNYIEAANIAFDLGDALKGYSFDFDTLRDTAVNMMVEQNISYIYGNSVQIAEENENGLVLEVQCAVLKDENQYSSEDVYMTLTIDWTGKFISLAVDTQ